MTLVLGLALCLGLGALAELAAAALGPPLGRRALAPFRRLVSDLRQLVRDRDRVSTSEALGVGAAALGASLATAAVLGGVPASAVMLYLALLLAATGGHLAAATAPTSAGIARAGRARLAAIVAEPAFVLGIAAIFLRWRTADLDAVRGAHDVLGLGLVAGEPAVVAGVALAALVVALAGALRLPAEPGEEAGASGGVAVAGSLARWLVAGATAMAVGGLVAARTLPSRHPFDQEGMAMLAAAAGAAVLVGVARALTSRLGTRALLVAAAAVAVLAGAAAVLVAGG